MKQDNNFFKKRKKEERKQRKKEKSLAVTQFELQPTLTPNVCSYNQF